MAATQGTADRGLDDLDCPQPGVRPERVHRALRWLEPGKPAIWSDPWVITTTLDGESWAGFAVRVFRPDRTGDTMPAGGVGLAGEQARTPPRSSRP
jgi:hypothetical protein